MITPDAVAKRLLLATLAAICLPVASWGQEPAPVPANPYGRKYPVRIYDTVHLQGKPPVIDGRLDDEAWKEGEWAGDYTQNTPTEGAKPSEATELKILYDDKNVYFAIRAYDDPAKVHRYPGRRDDIVGDIVGVCFSSYNDKKTGFEFDLTAGGSKIDLVLGNGELEWDTSWDAVWDGEVAHDDKGWTAEFRVPLSQLRYGPQEEQVWGLHAWRWIDRNQEEDQWQLIPRQNTGRMYQLGELHGIHGLKRSRHVELLPHVLAKAAPDPTADGSTDGSAGVGLDAKVGITSNLTLDATVNPDFGQVEADPSVLNLTAYETFYDEKRPFFLEGRKILAFDVDDTDQLFYSRRIGQAPSYAPLLGDGETIRSPESTTILSALKVTGKTADGLSVGAVQSLTQRETARIEGPSGGRDQTVEPFGSYSVARLHKDWGGGNTGLGGMITSTHRWISDPALAFLPSQATTGGVEFTRYFANRSWVLEGSGLFSHVSGDHEAIVALQTDPAHYYQRPDATHLGVDKDATSLNGHGGFVHFGRSDTSRLRLMDRFHWYSPGLELNDVGYLRQADVIANALSMGWNEPSPRGPFRDYSFQLSREDDWDFGGLQTHDHTAADVTADFKNKWWATGHFVFSQNADTRALRGGPALRQSDFNAALATVGTDPSRRAWLTLTGERNWASEGGSSYGRVATALNLRPSNRLSFSATTSYIRATDDLQYVATADTDGGQRWVLGRLDQDTWSLTLRASLSVTPKLTAQYYGSPFLSTGRYAGFKKATDTLADVYEARFHRYAAGEIAYSPTNNRYEVTEASGGQGSRYGFDNPDFSFRQFRSNLVVRWEYKPGSSLFVVWSQGRTDQVPETQVGFSPNWSALWAVHPDNVFLVKVSYWFSP
jgi:Domain of unknown function (DUF5916)/Carbohydrate family 9 binding domain-like